MSADHLLCSADAGGDPLEMQHVHFFKNKVLTPLKCLKFQIMHTHFRNKSGTLKNEENVFLNGSKCPYLKISIEL